MRPFIPPHIGAAFPRQKVILFVALLALPAEAWAGPIQSGQFTVEVALRQSVELFPGTPFNPGPTSLTVQADAKGVLTVTRQQQVGSTILTSPFAHLSGVFPAPLPPIPYEIFAGTPDLIPSQGVISNVVQNPLDPGFATGDPSSFVSGDFREEAYFKQVLPGGTTIYSDPNTAAIFTAHLTGLPYREGTTFTSPGRLNLYLQLGPGFDPTRDLLIGQSFDRTLTVVPEPTSLGLLAAGVLGLTGYVGKRRKEAMRGAELSAV